jgi:hypothetical protein
VRAPVSGIVLHVKAVPSLKKGDNIANLGVVAAKAPSSRLWEKAQLGLDSRMAVLYVSTRLWNLKVM